MKFHISLFSGRSCETNLKDIKILHCCHIVVLYYSKASLVGTTYFSKICYHRTFRGQLRSGASVPPISQVASWCVCSVFLLLVLEN
jgi:hypothetical protein